MIWNTEFTATSTTASSRSPQAKSFQTSTMAMHRARPTMISPVRYAGRSGSMSQAKVNIRAGPMTQFNSNDVPMVRRSFATLPTLAYFTFAKTGYIISNRPIAIGNETVPILTVSSHLLRPGIVRPSKSPRAIAPSIQSGRNRFSRDSRRNTSASLGTGAVGAIDPLPCECDSPSGWSSESTASGRTRTDGNLLELTA